MKKLLSIMLTLVLLAATLIIPVAVTAEETTAAFTPVSINFEEYTNDAGSNKFNDDGGVKCVSYSDTVDIAGGYCFSRSSEVITTDDQYGNVYYAKTGYQSITADMQAKTVSAATDLRLRFYNTFANAQAGKTYTVTFDIKRVANADEIAARMIGVKLTYPAEKSNYMFASLKDATGTELIPGTGGTVTFDDTYTYTSKSTLKDSIQVGVMGPSHESTPSTAAPCTVCGATKAYGDKMYGARSGDTHKTYQTYTLGDQEWHHIEHEVTITQDMIDQNALMFAIIGGAEYYVDNIVINEKPEVTTTLGNYYKFTFGENGYDYQVEQAITYKDNKFYPVNTATNPTAESTVTKETITDADSNKEVNVLRINNKSGARMVFTPLNKDGHPFELTPGKMYYMRVNGYVTHQSAYNSIMVGAGSQNDRLTKTQLTSYRVYNGTSECKTSTYARIIYPYNGNNFAYFGTEPATYEGEGNYGYKSTLTGGTTTATKYVYVDVQRRIMIPAVADFDTTDGSSIVYNAENQSYAITNAIYSDTSGTKVTGSDGSHLMLSGNNYAQVILSGNCTFDLVSVEIFSEDAEDIIHYYDEDGNELTDKQQAYTPDADPEVNGVEVAFNWVPENTETRYFEGFYHTGNGTTYTNWRNRVKKTTTGNTINGAGGTVSAKSMGSVTAYGGPVFITVDMEDYKTDFTADFSYNANYASGYLPYMYNSTFYNRAAIVGYNVEKTYNAEEGYLTHKHSSAWSERGTWVLTDKNGKPYLAKPNTKYQITVKYKMLSVPDNGMSSELSVGSGGLKSLAINGYSGYAGEKIKYSATAIYLNQVDTEWQEYTFNYTSNSLSDYSSSNALAVLALNTNVAPATAYLAEGTEYIADADGTVKVAGKNEVRRDANGNAIVVVDKKYYYYTKAEDGTVTATETARFTEGYSELAVQSVTVRVAENTQTVTADGKTSSVFSADAVENQKTYKVEFKYSVSKNNTTVNVGFLTANASLNSIAYIGGANNAVYTAANVQAGTVNTATALVTADMLDGATTLYGYVIGDTSVVNVWDVTAQEVSVVTNGGVSILTGDAAATAGSQALRYYYSYQSANGTDITIGDTAYTVVERGFIFRNGNNECYDGNNYVGGSGVLSESTKELTKCWASDGTTVTFSAYIKGFTENTSPNLTDNLFAKGYLVVKDAGGNQFTVYGTASNWCVNDVTATHEK